MLQELHPRNVVWASNHAGMEASVSSTVTCVMEKRTARMDQMRRTVNGSVKKVGIEFVIWFSWLTCRLTSFLIVVKQLELPVCFCSVLIWPFENLKSMVQKGTSVQVLGCNSLTGLA